MLPEHGLQRRELKKKKKRNQARPKIYQHVVPGTISLAHPHRGRDREVERAVGYN